MNHYPWWKNLLIVTVVVIGLFYAAPNIYGSDPALQVSAGRGAEVTNATSAQVRAVLDKAGIAYQSVVLDEKQQRLTVRFGEVETQLKARPLVQAALGSDYVVALNLLPAAPGWFSDYGARPVYLGLDLRGGVHFLMEVDMATVEKQTEQRIAQDIRAQLREEKIRYLSSKRVVREDGKSGVLVRFRDAQARDAARSVIVRNEPGIKLDELDQEGPALWLVLSDKYWRDTREAALQQNITTLRNRINELGVAEPIIQRQGQNRVIVELPGIQDTARAKQVIGATATLEFKLVDEKADPALVQQGRAPPGSRIYPMRQGGKIALKNRVILTGEHITDASSGIDPTTSGSIVNVSLDGAGARSFSRVTGKNIGKRLAVIFIENKVTEVPGEDGQVVRRTRKVEEVITAPVIQARLGRRFMITGMDSPREARDLALLLRAGSLAAPMTIVEERTVGPSLGQHNIDQGVKSVVIGLLLVLGFMALWYRVFGLVADLALLLNLALLVGALSFMQATLTLPGIAGIVLTVGMAVDANVLIFERIREELASGNTPQAAIYAGYERAFGTILDANVTTLIAALVLFVFGSGPVKGFAVTLSIGILTSMFTGIAVSRAAINLIYGRRRVKRLAI